MKISEISSPQSVCWKNIVFPIIKYMSRLVFIIVSLLTVHVVCDKSIYMYTYMYIRNQKSKPPHIYQEWTQYIAHIFLFTCNNTPFVIMTFEFCLFILYVVCIKLKVSTFVNVVDPEAIRICRTRLWNLDMDSSSTLRKHWAVLSLVTYTTYYPNVSIWTLT